MGRFGREITTKQVVFLTLFLGGLLGFLAYFWRDEIYDLASRASGRSASLVVDTTALQGRIRNTWGHIAQGGEDTKTNMLAPVSAQLKALRPQTVRIDHIYNGYDVVKRVNGQLTFDWTRLDAVVKSITDAGAVPMLALSYMPPDMGNGDITGLPTNWDEWSLVVQKTVERYSRDKGIEGVVYEVWNEPDLFGNFKTYGEKNYLTLYAYAAAGAARVSGVKPYEIGGPAITAYYPAWMENFLNYTTDNNIRVDFISWHRYSTSMDVYERDLRQMSVLLGQYREQLPRGLKMYLTETGPDSEYNSAYDGVSGAAHLVATVATTNDRVARVYAFELVDGKDPAGKQMWGRWGMLTHPDTGVVEKPRYLAMLWLNRLSGLKVPVQGQGSWVKALATKHKADGYQILIVNYDAMGVHSENVPLTLTGLPPGEYEVTREFFGKGKSSETVYVTAGSSGWGTEVGLSANQMVLIEIVKQDG